MFKIGDEIVCVEEMTGLTLSKAYEIIALGLMYGYDTVTIKDDFGNVNDFRSDRFVYRLSIGNQQPLNDKYKCQCGQSNEEYVKHSDYCQLYKGA